MTTHPLPYGALHLDFRNHPLPGTFLDGLASDVIQQQKNNKHAYFLSIRTADLSKQAPDFQHRLSELGFAHRFTNPKTGTSSYLKCLRGHAPAACNVPAYRSLSTGVSAIPMRRDPVTRAITHVLCIKEGDRSGIKGWKTVTGSVEMHRGERPVDAASRELREEVGLDIPANQAFSVGHVDWPTFRQSPPWPEQVADSNEVFGFEVSHLDKLTKQEEEVEAARWVPVSEIEKMLQGERASDGPVRGELLKIAAALKVAEAGPKCLYTHSGRTSRGADPVIQLLTPVSPQELNATQTRCNTIAGGYLGTSSTLLLAGLVGVVATLVAQRFSSL